MSSRVLSALSALSALGALSVALACNGPAPERSASKPSPAASARPTRPTPSARPSGSARATPRTHLATPGEQIPAPEDVARPPADGEKTPSGLVTKVLAAGEGGDKPRLQDRVTVHYTGWTPDGRMFDSSVARGAPTSFGVSGVIKGWTEALQLMTKGEKRRLWIPSQLAYGEVPKRPGAPAGPLVFDVELLELQRAPDPPPTPEDVAAAPKTAKKTKSGLAYRVLKQGKPAGKHPKATDWVLAHYSGWTTDGKLFDSSVMRGEPAPFQLTRVIPGWTEGLQLMKEGEKTRFWIPGELAYGDEPKRPGAPAGTLVFDVELLQVSHTPLIRPFR